MSLNESLADSNSTRSLAAAVVLASGAASANACLSWTVLGILINYLVSKPPARQSPIDCPNIWMLWLWRIWALLASVKFVLIVGWRGTFENDVAAKVMAGMVYCSTSVHQSMVIFF